jgi:hypothetical protein
LDGVRETQVMDERLREKVADGDLRPDRRAPIAPAAPAPIAGD